ncbi:MAG: hypothetical protein PUE54_00270 [Bacteroidales bacterium]|nr:hypothetical protein [Bacteroidales bacterium]
MSNKKGVILIDAAFAVRFCGDLRTHFEPKTGRALAAFDFAELPPLLALCADRSETTDYSVVYVYDAADRVSHPTIPGSPDELLDGVAFLDQMGEFAFSAISNERMVAVDEMFVQVLADVYVDNESIDVLITLGDCSTQDERIRDVLESMKCADIVNYSLRSASADAKYVTNNPVYPFAMMLGLTADELE